MNLFLDFWPIVQQWHHSSVTHRSIIIKASAQKFYIFIDQWSERTAPALNDTRKWIQRAEGLLKAVGSALVKEELQSYMVDWPLTIQGNNSSQRFVYFCHGPVHYGANVIMKSIFLLLLLKKNFPLLQKNLKITLVNIACKYLKFWIRFQIIFGSIVLQKMLKMWSLFVFSS